VVAGLSRFVPLAGVFYAAATVADVTVVPEDFECPEPPAPAS
jgi:hypothetical protein